MKNIVTICPNCGSSDVDMFNYWEDPDGTKVGSYVCNECGEDFELEIEDDEEEEEE